MMIHSLKVKSTKPILKTNIKTMTDDQQSVTMISEETDSWDDTETDHAYDHSSYQEANTDFLFPDCSSESDLDEEDSLFGTELLDNLYTFDHIVSSMQEVKGKLFFFSLLNYLTQNLSQHSFNTGVTC